MAILPLQALETHTADYVRLNAEKLDQQKHVVQVTGAWLGRVEGPWRWFTLFTHAGTIDCIVPVEKAQSFYERYDRAQRPSHIHDRKLEALVRTRKSGVPYMEVPGPATVLDDDATAADVHPEKVRTWTGTDGRKVEAELISCTETEVKIRRIADGRVFTLPRAQLSKGDNDFLAGLGS